MIHKKVEIKKQKIFKKEIDELEVEPHPKNNTRKKNHWKTKKSSECPSCKGRSRIEFIIRQCCEKCQYIIEKQKHLIDKTYLDNIKFFNETTL